MHASDVGHEQANPKVARCERRCQRLAVEVRRSLGVKPILDKEVECNVMSKQTEPISELPTAQSQMDRIRRRAYEL